MSALTTAAAVPAANGFSLEFVLSDGTLTKGPLSSTWQVRFETLSPARSVRTFKGQRNFNGLWWAAMTQSHVGFESWLEREHLMLLDFDPRVVAVPSQPFWLHWKVDDQARRHAPDFFVRCADGSAIVIDVRPDERIAPRDAQAFAATAEACSRAGWEYRRVGAVDRIRAANVRWLAGYRHRRCRSEAWTAPLLQAFSDPCSFTDGVSMVGDPMAVRPTAFHLLWTGHLTTDLDSRPLSGDSMVSARAQDAP